MNTTQSDPAPFPIEPIPPDLLAWSRQTFDRREYLTVFGRSSQLAGRRWSR